MAKGDKSWQVVGPLSGRLTVTDEDGKARFRRPGSETDGRTGVEKANARLILHRTAVLVLADSATGGRQLDLDDAPVRTWAVDTNLGQRGGEELRRTLAERRTRALASLAAATGAKVLEVRIEPQGAMITGTGVGGIRDVGIELHGTYGWPVIPATTLKGVADARARDTADLPAATRARIFGAPRPGGQSGNREDADTSGGDRPDLPVAMPGSVRFFDALPDPRGVAIAEHVLTPHVRDYHTGSTAPGGQRPAPAEYANPVPVPFLAVDGGTFIAHLVGPDDDVDLAARLLSDAVGDIGVGAKTSAGYGYMDASVGPPGVAGQGSSG